MTTKNFAQLSRTILMDGVAKKLLYWGFNTKGEVMATPEKISGGYTFRGDVGNDPNVPALWEALRKAVQQKGIEVVVEEAAYTWFNRLMALRIMAKNGYEPSLLQNAEGLEHTPLLLQKARQGQYAFLSAAEQERLKKIIGDYSKDQETFALLLVGYCHSNKMLNTVFGKLDDYTELLLPDNMLQDSGFLHLLNTTDAISDEEYQQVELIGWLYQFYISERKDEVFKSFKKKKKAEAKDIPAATQIFTPNWIVKYMVENTAGKIWLDKHPDSPIKENMKYLVSSEEGRVTRDENVGSEEGQGKSVEELGNEENNSLLTSHPSSLTPRPSSLIPNPQSLISNVEELTLLDPAVGSGHILVEGFDLLYQMYMEEYYTPEEAVESILKNNLYGLDLDDRAAQLANFAILLKAATQYRDVFIKGWMPNVYAMPESRDFSTQELKDFLGAEGKEYLEELDDALRLMKQAKNLGSVMKLSLSADAYTYIQKRYENLLKEDYLDINLQGILQGLKAYIPILLILTKKFAAVVANPPYMGQKNMNADLKNYVNANYPLSKSDLMTIFMEVIPNLTKKKASFALINLPSWMFLSSYSQIRELYVRKYHFSSLLHFGRGIFGSDFGSVAFCALKEPSENRKGVYRKLYSKFVTVDSIEVKEDRFLNPNYGYFINHQSNFLKIPSCTIGYWITENTLSLFTDEKKLKDVSIPKFGMSVGDGNKFLRNWSEVSFKNMNLNAKNLQDFDSLIKWAPIDKGGTYRKWYGNQEFIVNWKNNGEEIRNHKKSAVRSPQYFLQPHNSWTLVTAGSFSSRFFPRGFLIDTASNCIYFEDNNYDKYILGILNTKIAPLFLDIINPTINYSCGVVGLVPFIDKENIYNENLITENISLAKKDWDSRETSWNFEQSPLLNQSTNLEEAYSSWQKEVTRDFFQLHQNEEELNRIFIDIYGLQEELTPEVALKDITILQEELKAKNLEKDEVVLRDQGIGRSRDQGLGMTEGLGIRDENLSLVPNNYSLPINKAEVISQFISYAIGIFMGRYRLDKPGLHIAHPSPSAEELKEYLVIRDKGLGAIEQSAILNYIRYEHPEFSRSNGLAEINEDSNPSISNKQSIPERGNVWANEPNASGGSIGSEQYSGGASERNEGVSSLSENSKGFAGGDGNSTGDSIQPGVSGQQHAERDAGADNRNQQNAEWIKKEAEQLITNPSQLIPYKIDEDAILPLMGTDCNFSDDVLPRFNELLDIIWGADQRTENLNFIQDCLDKDLERFLVRDFYKYHCKMYKKKPIYWLFASPKGAFQVLVYMHRMNAFTVEKIRANYLLEHLKKLRSEEDMLVARESTLSSQEAKRLDQVRKDIVECETYDMELKEIADQQIEFDLDDGVSVNYEKFKTVVAKI